VDLSRAIARTTLWALVGGVVGLLAGLLLQSLRVVENPFWLLAAGLVAGAVASQLLAASRRRG
jgi:uncharacterized membrane protein YeaQ/YmgE (transglycosylase-associated protein family)